jgi:hypothetical protein
LDGIARNIKRRARRLGSPPALTAENMKMLVETAEAYCEMGFADCTVEPLKREVDSLLSVPLDAKWTDEELPIPKNLFV